MMFFGIYHISCENWNILDGAIGCSYDGEIIWDDHNLLYSNGSTKHVMGISFGASITGSTLVRCSSTLIFCDQRQNLS